MRVMGIDPGSNCTGYGIIEEVKGRLQCVHWGAIRAKPKQDFAFRLKNIYDALQEVIRDYHPNVVAVEDLFFSNNAKSAIKLGQTRGVILLAAVKESKLVAEYTPLEVKQAVVGYGRAEKVQVQNMVCRLLGLSAPPEPLDASDALAIAICHANTVQLNAKIKV